MRNVNMCNAHNPRKIDKCMKKLLPYLAIDYITSCCCGHGKYPMTIVAWDDGEETYYEVLSQINIPRKKRFYTKDKQGYYYIKEVCDEKC